MNSLRTCAAVLALVVFSVLVGCVSEGTVDEQEPSQTSATTFGATVSTTTATNTPILGHASSVAHAPLQSQTAVIDPLGNP